MTIHFQLRYHTRFGESLSLSLNDDPALIPMQYLDEETWVASLDINTAKTKSLIYRYHFRDSHGEIKTEWGNDRLLDAELLKSGNLTVMDYWNDPGAIENAFFTQPFQKIFNPPPPAKTTKITRFTHVFRVKAPLLKSGEVIALLGHGIALRNWDIAAPLLLQREGNWWTIRLDLGSEDFPLAYKFGVWNTKTNKFLGFENGTNRALYAGAQEGKTIVLHDGFAHFPNNTWRGAGVAIPVFSLRTTKSWGVGEFTDLHLLADWAQSVGLKIIQLLPVNDTIATGTRADSYPYSAISAYALHPMFLNLEQVAGKEQAELLKPYAKKQKALNALDAVDYEAVMPLKWEIIRQLYAAQKAAFLKDTAFLKYFDDNKHWLIPYAAFCYLRDKNGTADFSQWKTNKTYKAEEIEKLSGPTSKNYDEIALHYFVQWHLHLQLKASADYAHSKGIALKGDIPIGIYRHSCDAWISPELYNMGMQAGAPPDDFAVNGQNWGFPTYDWAKMKQDGFAWWRQRFEQMSLYFDAFRIDHILGFFRIWSIPLDAVEGILGRFVPALPVTEQEFRDAGIGFNFDRFCQPYITERVLWEIFGDAADAVKSQYLTDLHNGQFRLKPAFDTQRKVDAHFAGLPETPENTGLRDGLMKLLANVILLPLGATPDGEKAYAFRIAIDKTSSFQHLDPALQPKLNALYVDYFFRRQDEFWRREAMEKLPALKRSTNMLICGEDLGMVPACVPDVMAELGFLSLEIQRMPKKTGVTFFHPREAPYLSVVTPSTHDMSTLRGWWEEDRGLTQRFYNEVLGEWGTAPLYCEPWVNRRIVEQHFHSPAMWSIFQLQDLMGIDGALRRQRPEDERINVPANPKHYWRYRMHLNLEDLLKKEGFNSTVRQMVEETGR